MKKGCSKLQRLGAYIIDYIFILLLITLLGQLRFLNPTFDEYYKTYDESMEMINNTNEEDIFKLLESEEYSLANYNLAKYSVSISIISIIVYLGYFVGFQKWNKNQTLGKKLFNIEVASIENTDVKWWQILLREIIIYNLIAEILYVILILFLNVNSYFMISNIILAISSLISLINVILILFRKDGRGLHDLLAKTIVVEKDR